MKPTRKKEDMADVVSMDGMTFKPSRTDLRNVFKERGRMSNLVMDSMIVWLMKEEKERSPKKYGVSIPRRHMFSSTFVENLRNIRTLKKQNVLTDRVDPNILGYDVAMCNLASIGAVYYFEADKAHGLTMEELDYPPPRCPTTK
ncbi:uncharacterized protein LOC131330259 [Rhododendron vialii]|uniref:uncharacterized protein LOC131330259 n=1 Tax=Rhododendron vialii TaxID=182163 RepID=UPI00265F1DDC|nr:uncharacterized protein LOC131330259 [Rhododendron vialii]